MSIEKILDNIAYEITEDWEDYQKAKIFLDWYFEGDDIETLNHTTGIKDGKKH